MRKHLVLIGLVLLSTVTGAYAYTIDGYNPRDVNTWNQLVQTPTTFGPLYRDFTLQSCMIQAATFAQIKIGNKPIGFEPIHMKEEFDSVNGYSENGFAIYDSISWGDDWEVVQQNDNFDFIPANLQDAINYYNEGYFVFMRVLSPAGHHQIAIDYIDEQGRIIIFDSGFKGYYYTDIYNEMSVSEVTLLKSKSGKKAYDLPHLTDLHGELPVFEQPKVPEPESVTEEVPPVREVNIPKDIVPTSSDTKVDDVDMRNVEDNSSYRTKLLTVDEAVKYAELDKTSVRIAYAKEKVNLLRADDRKLYLDRLSKLD